MAGARAALASVPLALVVLSLAPGAGESRAAQACRASQFEVSFGRDLSSPTGRMDTTLRLANRGAACLVRGYPALTFLDARRDLLPLVIRRGGGMMVTSRPPRLVNVRHGRSAWIVLEQYRCDRGVVDFARTALIGLPGDGGTTQLRLPRRHAVEYCGQGDPGSIVFASPVAQTQRAALHRWGPGPG
jgi:hypothetical protein